MCVSARKPGRVAPVSRQGTDGSLPRANVSPPLEGTLPPLSLTSLPSWERNEQVLSQPLGRARASPAESHASSCLDPWPFGARLQCALTRGELESRCPWRMGRRPLGLDSRSPAGMGRQDRDRYQRSLSKLEPPPRLPPLQQPERENGRRPFQPLGSWPQKVPSSPFQDRASGQAGSPCPAAPFREGGVSSVAASRARPRVPRAPTAGGPRAVQPVTLCTGDNRGGTKPAPAPPRAALREPSGLRRLRQYLRGARVGSAGRR